MLRERLPDRRRLLTTECSMGGQTVYYSIGFYDDGRPGELWVDLNKFGSVVRAWAGAASMLTSMLLQYGVPLQEVVGALKGWNSEPFGTVPVEGCPGVEDACGVLDMIAQSIDHDYSHHYRFNTTTMDVLADALDVVAGAPGEDKAELIRAEFELRGKSWALDEFLRIFDEDAE